MRVSRLPAKKSLQNRCNTPPSSLDVPDQPVPLHSPAFASRGYVEIQAHSRQTNICVDNQGPGYLERELLARGIRLTEQRRTILRVIEASPHCRNAGVIHRRAKSLNSAIHRVTIYRTLALLERYGVVDERGSVQACTGEDSCPYASECNQIQMRCLQCGRVAEFTTRMLGDVTRCVEKDCRFRVARAALDLVGYCQSCRV